MFKTNMNYINDLWPFVTFIPGCSDLCFKKEKKAEAYLQFLCMKLFLTELTEYEIRSRVE